MGIFTRRLVKILWNTFTRNCITIHFVRIGLYVIFRSLQFAILLWHNNTLQMKYSTVYVYSMSTKNNLVKQKVKSNKYTLPKYISRFLIKISASSTPTVLKKIMFQSVWIEYHFNHFIQSKFLARYSVCIKTFDLWYLILIALYKTFGSWKFKA